MTVVFSDDYSEQLENTAFRSAVWLADTPANHAAAEGAWHAAVEWPHISVTLFRPPAAEPTRDEWRTLIEQIKLQGHAFDAIDVIGAPLTPSAGEALSESGFTRLEETAEGFRARKV